MGKYYLAVDIGASSGRHILGRIENGKMELEEIYRFENGMNKDGDHLIWDVERLGKEIVNGIAKCKEIGKIPETIGIDTWGVDYVLLDENDEIIGIVGNRHPSFNVDLDSIVADINRISALGKPMCICGDFNCSFADGYYFTKHARQELQKVFGDNGIKLLTVNQPECIDHIAITESIVNRVDIIVEEWNEDKQFSDHKGVAVNILNE